MGKIHPILLSTSATTSATAATTTSPSGLSTCDATSATFTMWMKSLVMNGNGCTIYDENGGVVYRVDNYQTKGGREVCLMDLKGNLVFTIIKTGGYSLLCGPFRTKKWKGYRCDDETASFEVVRKRRPGAGVVVIGGVKRFEMEASSAGKLTAFKITDVVNGGVVVAEAKRKQTSGNGGGVMLGDDVLTLVVRPGVDRSLVMGLATVYGLMSRRL